MMKDSHKKLAVEGYRIVAHTRPRQAAARIKTPAGWTERIRLKDASGKRLLLPEGKTPQDMGPDFIAECTLAVMRIAQEMVLSESFRTPNRKIKTCIQAMEMFEAAMKRDHHGNAFKEFFGTKPLSAINKKSVPEFVENLLVSYDRNEATVSKKVFAASALFKWLIKNDWWIGTNPFSAALSGVRFAPASKKKDTIEKAELDRLMAVLADEQFEELRILVEILYCTGMRPSEAISIKCENIDSNQRVLTYLRTKRKNRTPDWRRIPIANRLVAFIVNTGRTKGNLVNLTKTRSEALMRAATTKAGIDGMTLETFRKDFAFRARTKGVSVDDVNLYQGRQETILEKHYTTGKMFIVNQCRGWIDMLFADKPGLKIVK